MTTDTLTARNKLARQVPRSHRPPADEPLADASRRARAPTLHVIVAFDGSPAAKDALALAALLADPARSELLVACVFPPESLAGISFDPRADRIANGDHRLFVRQDAEAVLGEARAILPPDLAVKFRAVECDSALHGLQHLALSAGADVLVVGSTRRGTLGRLPHRSLAGSLLRDPPCAVTVVPHDPRDRLRPESARLNARSAATDQPAEPSPGLACTSGTGYPFRGRYRKHLIEDLEDFRLSGGRWRIVSVSNERAVVDLCTYSGEPLKRLESDDPAAIAYLRTKQSPYGMN
jgi:nucleotide-binding universal stress UspA family protein